MIENKYLKLKNMFSCYFHQDMDLEYPDVESAIKAYVIENSDKSIKLTLIGIDELKKEHYSEKYLDDFISTKLGSLYNYKSDNLTGEQWLDYVYDTINKYLYEKYKISIQHSGEVSDQNNNI